MKNHFALVLIGAVALLFAIGQLMVFNATSAVIIDRDLNVDPRLILYKQLLFGGVGFLLGWVAYSIGYQKLLRYSFHLLVCVTILLGLVFVPGIGQKVNGASRWIHLANFSFQPSECAKIIIPLFFIRWQSMQSTIDWKQFFKILGYLAIPGGLILIEPDNGTVAILFLTMIALFWLSRISFRLWGLPLLALVVLGAAVSSQMPHVPGRIQVYLHPESDIRGKGHQPHQAKIAAGSGGFLGRGFGESLQKLNYLPEARNDYIAAIYAEEMGFLGMCLLIGLYGMICYSGFSIALLCSDRRGFLLGSTIAFLISIQAFLNLGIVSGLLPSKGMTLPFFSQGGSSLMVHIASIFILLDIAKRRRVENTF